MSDRNQHAPLAGANRDDAATTDTERRLAGLWADVLRVSEVRLDDSFVDLGGDSLDAKRVLIRIQKELGVTLSLAAFAEAPTVRGLAARIDRARAPALAPAASGDHGQCEEGVV